MSNALVYCQSGGGKTVNSTLVKGNNLLLCSDNSQVVLNNFKRPNTHIEVVHHWYNFDNKGIERECFASQFEKAVETKKYNNIIVDNVSDLFDLAILEFDESGKFKDMRQAYQITYQTMKRLARKAGQLDCNVIFTAWQEIEEFTNAEGKREMRIKPKLPEKILDNFLGLCNIVAYLNSTEKDGKRIWYYKLEGNSTLYAKDQLYCRKSCMPENIFEEVKK